MISVVMPAFNAEPFVAQAVESILGQSVRDLELIVVDDGSTDRTPAILRRYAQRSSRVRVIEGGHRGVSRALNRGFEEAQGDWVAVMHADDIALPERLARQLDAAAGTPEVVVWGTDGFHATSSGRALSYFRSGPRDIDECAKTRAACEMVQAIHSTVMMRRSVFEKAGGYDSRFDGAEDVELFDRMLEFGPLVSVAEPLLIYRVHGGTLSMTRHAIQHHIMCFVTMRHRWRLEGRPELSYEEYLEIARGMTRYESFLHTRWNFSKLSYRRAGMAFGEGQMLKAAFHFTQAAVVNPRYALKRFWDQWAAPHLRHQIPHDLPATAVEVPDPGPALSSQGEL